MKAKQVKHAIPWLLSVNKIYVFFVNGILEGEKQKIVKEENEKKPASGKISRNFIVYQTITRE